MNKDYKFLYNALNIIGSKSEDLGFCNGRYAHCRNCKNPLCTKLGVYDNLFYVKTMPLVYDIDTFRELYKCIVVIKNFCGAHFPCKEDCPFRIDGKYACLFRITPFVDFAALTELIERKINE